MFTVKFRSDCEEFKTWHVYECARYSVGDTNVSGISSIVLYPSISTDSGSVNFYIEASYLNNTQCEDGMTMSEVIIENSTGKTIYRLLAPTMHRHLKEFDEEYHHKQYLSLDK